MRSLGTITPRTPDALGVAGLLSPTCKVFYFNLFTHRAVGRVSDLLAARLREEGFDELHLRALLLFSVFESYSERARTGVELNSRKPGHLNRVITFECGMDEEKLAVGFRIPVDPANEQIDPEVLPRRVRSEEPDGDLERFLVDAQRHCELIIIRNHRPTLQIEVVLLLGIPGKIAPLQEGKAQIEVILLSDAPLPEPAPAGEYIEIGDLEYQRLLTTPEETRVGGSEKGPAETETVVGGEPDFVDEFEKLIPGQKGQRESVTRISGTTLHIGDSSERVVRSNAEGEKAERFWKVPLGGLLKKVWDFSRGVGGESGADEAEEEQPMETASAKALAEVTQEPVVIPKVVEESAPDAAGGARRLMIELQGGNLDRTLAKAQREIGSIKKEIANPRAQRWVEGLMSDLVSEKARLHELARKLNTSVRQKEVEFRNKETALKEEIRRRDETLRQKEHLIARTKDQVLQLRMSMDRMKGSQMGAADETHYRQKFNLTQKLYLSAKEENSRISVLNEQMKAEVTTLRYSVKKGEEYKKQYLALVDRSADQKTGGVAANAAKRAETEAKMAAVYRKEATDLRGRTNELQLKVDEVEREEERLKKEVARLQTELKASKSKPGAAA